MDTREYRQEVAFINPQRELEFLHDFIDKHPSEILFLHGPKSSGKTTLLYRFFEEIEKEERLDIKFLNLREVWLGNYHDFLRVFFAIKDEKGKEESVQAKLSVGIFSITSDVKNKMLTERADPFAAMKNELKISVESGKKPIIIIDEVQALADIYYNGEKD